jgi:hypothetical protein
MSEKEYEVSLVLKIRRAEDRLIHSEGLGLDPQCEFTAEEYWLKVVEALQTIELEYIFNWKATRHTTANHLFIFAPLKAACAIKLTERGLLANDSGGI